MMLHDNVRISGLSQSNHFLRPIVELSSDLRGLIVIGHINKYNINIISIINSQYNYSITSFIDNLCTGW